MIWHGERFATVHKAPSRSGGTMWRGRSQHDKHSANNNSLAVCTYGHFCPSCLPTSLLSRLLETTWVPKNFSGPTNPQNISSLFHLYWRSNPHGVTRWIIYPYWDMVISPLISCRLNRSKNTTRRKNWAPLVFGVLGASAVSHSEVRHWPPIWRHPMMGRCRCRVGRSSKQLFSELRRSCPMPGGLLRRSGEPTFQHLGPLWSGPWPTTLVCDPRFGQVLGVAPSGKWT